MDEDVKSAFAEIKKLPKKQPSSVRDSSDKSLFMSQKQVLELIPVSRSSLYLMMNKGEFPRPKKLGQRAAAWSKFEVNNWIQEKLDLNDAIYVVVASNDKPHKMPGRKEPFFDDGGPLVFEQYTRSGDLESITKRKQRLEQIWGKCRIAKLVFMEEI